MKFLKIQFLLLLFLFTGCSKDYLFQIDKTLNTIHLKQDGLEHKFEVSDFKNERTVKNNKQWYYWFDGKKIIKTEGDFEPRLLNGKYTSFYPNNQLHSKGQFYLGQKKGIWRYWNNDGKLIRKDVWMFGKIIQSKNILQEEKERFLKEMEEQKEKEKEENSKSKPQPKNEK